MDRDITPTESIKVIVAEDHPRMRKAIRRMLDHSLDIRIIGEASDGQQALDMTLELEPHILLLDLAMPGMNGMQVAKILNQKKCPVKILVLSSYHDKQIIKGMLARGVSGYLTKEEAPEALVQAVRSLAYQGDLWLSRKVANKVSSSYPHQSEHEQSGE
jgi:DNA-binding NarL/FixJ family response regulator